MTTNITDIPLVDAPARDRIRDAHDATLFVEAGAGTGKTTALVGRIVALVLRGRPLDRIAAITFTEKAAAELRERTRSELERVAAETDDDEVRRRCITARDAIDVAAIGTLHGFARRLLRERAIEAGLPPNLDVLDEVASEIAFDRRWDATCVKLLDDPALGPLLLVADALGLPLRSRPGKATLKPLMRIFSDNWDRLLDPAAVPWTIEDVPDVAAMVRPFADDIDALIEMMTWCTDPEDKLLAKLQVLPGYADELARLTDDPVGLVTLLQHGPKFAFGRAGAKGSWDGRKDEVTAAHIAIKEQRGAVLASITGAVLQSLAVVVRDEVLLAVDERRAAGELEFHDLLVLARQMLVSANGLAVRRSLRRRWELLLLDEFQDTDPIQLEIARLLGTDPDAVTEGAEPDPGRLFFVGDPKQSIYRFRRADIALYLRAAKRFGDGDHAVALRTNFRSGPKILSWINATFGELIREQTDAQPAYEPLLPAPSAADPTVGPGVLVLGAEMREKSSASELRWHEASLVADAVVRALDEGWTVRDETAPRDEPPRWRPARPSDIAILVPARTSLPMLEQSLQDAGVVYRADTSSLVYATREIRDVIMTLRAALDPADELAVVSALRSTVFGCGDDDLLTWVVSHDGGFDPTRRLHDDAPADHPVAEGLRFLSELHEAAHASTPEALLTRIVDERRLLELGMLARRPRDVWRRLRFVIDQARLWSETTNGSLPEYLSWVRMQASDSVRVAEAILPETDDDAVRILTVHAAKGLEFPITILSGMTTKMVRPGKGVRVLWGAEGQPVALKAKAGIATPEFDIRVPIDEQLDHEERIRLLYVAATRARDHLVVSLVREPPPKSGFSAPTSATALADACLTRAEHDVLELDEPGRLAPAAAVDAPGPFDHTAWEAERERVIAGSAVRSTWSATALQHRVAATRASTTEVVAEAVVEAVAEEPEHDHVADVTAGIDKDAPDLDLPSWRKGRYGSALGRAVHAVLQTVDLDTGDGIEATARGQAAAEDIVGHEDVVARLARAAITAPIVREAVASEYWRESYVATSIGETTIEGYIDLLVRRPDGSLVVVDYKTASRLNDIDDRLEHYRGQGATYALAVEQATGMTVADVVFVFVSGDGVAERRISDLDAAKGEVRALLASPLRP